MTCQGLSGPVWWMNDLSGAVRVCQADDCTCQGLAGVTGEIGERKNKKSLRRLFSFADALSGVPARSSGSHTGTDYFSLPSAYVDSNALGLSQDILGSQPLQWTNDGKEFVGGRRLLIQNRTFSVKPEPDDSPARTRRMLDSIPQCPAPTPKMPTLLSTPSKRGCSMDTSETAIKKSRV